VKIQTILDQIDLGSITLSEFQRGYVWTRRSDAVMLEDVGEHCGCDLTSQMIIRVLHGQVFCLRRIIQMSVGGDENELADTTGSQLSLDD
jgi:hypothetical protein